MCYFSPEMVKTGKKTIYGSKTDMWALGVSLYQMATKKYPFRCFSIQSLQHELLNSEPDFSLIKDQLFISFLKKIFIKDPNLRSSASDLLDDPWLTEFGGIQVTLYESF